MREELPPKFYDGTKSVLIGGDGMFSSCAHELLLDINSIQCLFRSCSRRVVSLKERPIKCLDLCGDSTVSRSRHSMHTHFHLVSFRGSRSDPLFASWFHVSFMR